MMFTGSFPRVCAWCGEAFKAKHPRHRCCSPSCSNQYGKQQIRAADRSVVVKVAKALGVSRAEARDLLERKNFPE